MTAPSLPHVHILYVLNYVFILYVRTYIYDMIYCNLHSLSASCTGLPHLEPCPPPFHVKTSLSEKPQADQAPLLFGPVEGRKDHIYIN